LPETVLEVTVARAVRSGARRLAEAGCEAPRLDAEVLLAWVLGVGRERLVLDGRLELGADALARYCDAIARRAAREPVAYITGSKEFRRISLAVDRRVLIPRPETELLVEVGLSLGAGLSVVDVGTGSGAVALALKDERPDLSVAGTDVDPGALAVARANAVRLGLEVGFMRADLLEGVDGRFDAVLANLPYVVPDAADLPPEIALYEPRRALFGGHEGLELVRRLVGMVEGVPLVALEVGFDQAPAASAVLAGAGFGSVERLRDLAGHERVLVGRR
jgi:release factor glutamine methyltransferase